MDFYPRALVNPKEHNRSLSAFEQNQTLFFPPSPSPKDRASQTNLPDLFPKSRKGHTQCNPYQQLTLCKSSLPVSST